MLVVVEEPRLDRNHHLMVNDRHDHNLELKPYRHCLDIDVVEGRRRASVVGHRDLVYRLPSTVPNLHEDLD